MKFPKTIRAEILTNVIFPEGKPEQEQCHVSFMGGFKRNYRNDIDYFSIDSTSEKGKKLIIHLNRNGFYDKLPEALFHRIDYISKQRSGIKKTGQTDYAEVQAQQQKYARKLFQPMENEFFRLSSLVDNFFLKHLQDANSKTVDYLFGKDGNWSCRNRQHASLFSFNALFYSTRGNLRKIGIFLSSALQTKVEVAEEQGNSEYENNNPGFHNTFGKMILGENSVCGSFYTDHAIRWVFRVGANHSLLQKLIESPDYQKIFYYVQSSLIPAGVEGVFKIVGLQPVKVQLTSADSKELNQYLGYNTAI